MAEMYVVKAKNSPGGTLYELRQTRFKAQFDQGIEHSHDVCAYARSVDEMHGMVDKYWDDIDYSAVEGDAHG